jgi:high-affinity iron transporter|mmetsp:Transcript_12553/g.22758  ORF Transcript_12553/g.22758 Transcript_12553/m.22758 type:complete len:313 (-) Transcript_12553:68-1006(-)|eukprot:CAMPEP_0198288636 /NCGR_PEP_ID=MMETSP1449-20131203/7069_1 /TAXON_ID=420275 /ORGANISM="Attheya septentrionalis, Strain CCMP2084" /LENGTH=312 /DNA_ID=CAMNT_0043986815 /DNA_START=110 /DNA_END=1048 /DNA_ORIENTATION=+
MSLFYEPMATIFAREFFEAAIIIGQYRTVLLRSPEWQEEQKQKEGLKAINQAALAASAVAVIVTLCVLIPLLILGNELDKRTAEVIEGISKVIAAMAILQISVLVPKLLGVYVTKKSNDEGVELGLTMRSIRFNVFWNIWREVAEIGIFLIPILLGDGASASTIPLSALVGMIIAAALGGLIYYGNQKLEDKKVLAFFMATVLVFLSVGLFVGGCHEFEEVWGETRKVWKIENNFWSHKELPMVVLKPFGYSASRTVLQMCTFWLWLGLAGAVHLWFYLRSQKILAQRHTEKELKSYSSDEEMADNDVEETA